MSGILLASSYTQLAPVVEPESGQYKEKVKLTPSDGVANGNFGYSTVIYENTMAVGAPRDDDKGVESGSVYLYDKISNNFSVSFNGTTDYLNIAPDTILGLGTSDFTIEAWIRFPSLPATGKSYPIIGNVLAGTDNNYYILTVMDTGKIRLTVRDTASQFIIDGGSQLTPNVWHHVAVCRSGNSFIIFVNGVVQNAGTISKTITQRTTVIGAFLYTNFENYFNGNISNLRILKGVALYLNDFSVSTTPLTAIPNTILLTCNTQNIDDISNNNYSVNKVGNVTATSTVTPFTTSNTWTFVQKLTASDGIANSRFGSAISIHNNRMVIGAPVENSNKGSAYVFEKNNIGNNSLYFDGINSYLRCDQALDSFTLATSQYTIEGWVYPLSTTNQSFVGINTSASGYNTLVISTRAIIASTQTYTHIMPSNHWTHFALVNTGSSAKYYLNGVLVRTVTVDEALSTCVLGVGAEFDSANGGTAGDYFNGYISNFRVSSGTVYTANFISPRTPITADTTTMLLLGRKNEIVNESFWEFPITKFGNVTVSNTGPFMFPYVWEQKTKLVESLTVNYGSSVAVYSDKIAVGSHGSNTNRGEVYTYSPNQTPFIGNSVYFDGSGDYLRCDTALDSFTVRTSIYTIEGWCFPTSDTSGFVIGINAASNGANVILIGNRTFGYNSVDTTNVMTTNRWNHFAFVSDGTQGKYYINGVLNRTVTIISTVLSSCVLGIGTEFDAANGGTPGNYFTGYATDVRITGSQVYTSNFTPPTTSSTSIPNTTALLCQASTFKDNGPNNLAVTVYGNPAIIQFNPFNNSNLWTMTNKITASDGIAGDSFGHSVLLNDTSMLSGSINDDDKGTDSGSVYKYDLTLTSSSLTQKLTPNDGAANDKFGSSMALYNSTLLIGSPKDDDKGTDSGSVYTYEYETMIVNHSVYFDGSGDYLSIDDNPALELGSNNFTIELWMYAMGSNPSNGTSLISKSNTGSFGPFAIGFNPPGFLAFTGTSVSNTWSFNIPSAVHYNSLVNKWSHLALVRNGNNFNLYLNGVSVASTSFSGVLINNTEKLMIGYINYVNTFFTGYVSNVRMVNGTALYTSNFTPSSTPLTAVTGTVLLTCQDSSIKDNSVNNLPITLNGNAAYSNQGPFTSVTANGWVPKQKLSADASNSNDNFGSSVAIHQNIVAIGAPYHDDKGTDSGSVYVYNYIVSQNYSVSFDGAGDYITVPSSSEIAFGTGDFTIEFWMNSNDVSGATQRGMLQTSTTAGGFATTYTTGITFFQGASSNNYGALDGGLLAIVGGVLVGSTSPTIQPNTWIHVALVRATSVSKLYINGSVVGSASTPANLTGTNMVIGGYYNISYLFNGYISNLRIVKGTAIYTTNFTPSATPLTAVSGTSLLTCNSASIVDGSANNFTLTIFGNTSVSTIGPYNGTEMLQKLVASDAADNDNFGQSVAVFNDTIAVGSYLDDDKGTDSGSVYIYEK